MEGVIARVFPRRTRATPTDALAFIGYPPLFLPRIDEVHVSVVFDWDLEEANRLAVAWSKVATTKIGGPACGMPGGSFTPGKYLSHGYVITSRGCPNRCWFCGVWRREGPVRELPICDGWDVLDDNLLACSAGHIASVFDMLSRQPRPPKFTGGLEAARLTKQIATDIRGLHPDAVFFAYDTPEDLAPLRRAGELMHGAGMTSAGHRLRAYVLCGYPGDTIKHAESRMVETVDAGFFPMAMPWRTGTKITGEWRRFARLWSRPALIARSLANTEEATV